MQHSTLDTYCYFMCYFWNKFPCYFWTACNTLSFSLVFFLFRWGTSVSQTSWIPWRGSSGASALKRWISTYAGTESTATQQLYDTNTHFRTGRNSNVFLLGIKCLSFLWLCFCLSNLELNSCPNYTQSLRSQMMWTAKHDKRCFYKIKQLVFRTSVNLYFDKCDDWCVLRHVTGYPRMTVWRAEVNQTCCRIEVMND